MTAPPGIPGMRVEAFDPEPDEVERIVLQVDPDRYVLAYHEPFVAAIDAGNEALDEESPSPLISVEFQPFRLRIGLLRSIEQRVRAAIRGELDGLAQDILLILAERSIAGNSDGGDCNLS